MGQPGLTRTHRIILGTYSQVKKVIVDSLSYVLFLHELFLFWQISKLQHFKISCLNKHKSINHTHQNFNLCKHNITILQSQSRTYSIRIGLHSRKTGILVDMRILTAMVKFLRRWILLIIKC